MNETFNLIIKGNEVSAVFAAAARGLALRAVVETPRSGWTKAQVVCARSALIEWMNSDQAGPDGYPPGALLYFAFTADVGPQPLQPLAQSALEMGREARAGRGSAICPFPASSLLAQAWLSGYEEETLRHG